MRQRSRVKIPPETFKISKMIELFERKRILPIIFTFLIGIEIFIFSSIPGSPLTEGQAVIGLSELYHFIVFFLFNFFLFISIKGEAKINKKYILVVLALSITYAILDEVHQFFVPSRVADIGDIFTDFAGIFSSTLLYLQLSRKKLIVSE